MLKPNLLTSQCRLLCSNNDIMIVWNNNWDIGTLWKYENITACLIRQNNQEFLIQARLGYFNVITIE